jgi:hypothetical protein
MPVASRSAPADISHHGAGSNRIQLVAPIGFTRVRPLTTTCAETVRALASPR